MWDLWGEVEGMDWKGWFYIRGCCLLNDAWAVLHLFSPYQTASWGTWLFMQALLDVYFAGTETAIVLTYLVARYGIFPCETIFFMALDRALGFDWAKLVVWNNTRLVVGNSHVPGLLVAEKGGWGALDLWQLLSSRLF